MPSTPKRNKKYREWETPTRVRVITLLEPGVNPTQVARRTGVPRSTVVRWRQDPHPRRGSSTRTGRPWKLDKHDIRRLIALLRTDCQGRKLSWSNFENKPA
ncbi:hypothetical protein FPQ18DRAFT_395209 [Pyronema domesticum]|nr:hypothetical protein FPQ18DRAFT_395209 [Pyronema domesticum]